MRARFLIVATLALLGCAWGSSRADDAGKVEYLDIRWDGTDRMCIVFPDGHVDFVGHELERVIRPDDANKRAFYMTLAMNKMAAQGWELASMISDEIVMKRAVAH